MSVSGCLFGQAAFFVLNRNNFSFRKKLKKTIKIIDIVSV